MDEILWLLFEVVFELVGEVVLEIGRAIFGSLDAATGDALFTAFTWFVVGALIGLLSGIVMPERLLPRPRTAGLSLMASPVACGATMGAWGRFRRSRGRATSSLATVEGGAAFALGMALGRFVLVA